jgi:hypothetical protein
MKVSIFGVGYVGLRIPHDEVLDMLRNKHIFGGRNLNDPMQMKEKEWTYCGIGRGESCREFNSVETVPA